MNNENKDTLLSLQGISLKFPGQIRSVLQEISYNIQSGDFVVILGTNGSGKSSLLKVINATYKGYRGKLQFNYMGDKNINSKTYQKYIATITQDIDANLFLGLSVLENCLLYESKYAGGTRAKSSDARIYYKEYLGQYHSALGNKTESIVSNLSGGEKQSLILGLTLLHDPLLLLLDEHTSALDPVTGDKLMKLTADIITMKKITCIMTTHSLEDALRYGNKMIALKDGEIVFSATQNQKAKLTKADLVKYCY